MNVRLRFLADDDFDNDIAGTVQNRLPNAIWAIGCYFCFSWLKYIFLLLTDNQRTSNEC